MAPLDEAFQPIPGGLIDGNGNRREVGPFPDGGKTSGGISYARTLDDYRHLYREYLTDPACSRRGPMAVHPYLGRS
ncbi:MAG: hypothetical protein MPW15_00550 [Candidatus Manganitrophus sp.]|nr:hypothetical protein [Candidatus Manganitrophus sp.]